MSLIQPLDLQTLLVNTFAGNFYIFVFLFAIFIAGMAARFRMPTTLFGVMMALFAISITFWAPWVLGLSIIVAALIIFALISRFVR